MHDIYKEVQKIYSKMFLSLGMGEFVVSLVGIVDMIAVAQLGIFTIAGYAYAIAIVSFLYLNYDALNIFGYVEYTKEKDSSVLYSIRKLGYISQIILSILIYLVSIFFILFSGLSGEANQIVFQVLLIRSIGAYFFTQSTVYYIYLRTEHLESIAMFARCVCFISNTFLDILVIIYGYGVLGVVLATVVGELLEYLFLRLYFYIRKIKFKKDEKGQVKSYLKKYLSGYVVGLAQKIQYAMVGVITSWMGDDLYAIYGLLCSVISQLLWFTGVCGTITETVYAEFKDKVKDKIILFKTLLKSPLKILSLYSVFSLLILPYIYDIMTLNSGVELNYILLIILLVFWIFMEAYFYFFEGIFCLLEEYNLYTKFELLCIPLLAITTLCILPLKNPYLSYSFGWIIVYSLRFLIAYKVGLKKFKLM